MVRPDGRASARKSFVFLAVGMVVFFFASASSADVPDSINYQGKLTTASGGCLNDTVSMTFTIYSDDQGTVVDWTETQNSVIVKEGIFNVLLGSVAPLPALIFDGSTKYLGVQVESDPEMSPLKPMVTTAYAFHSATADSAFNVPAAGIVSVDGVSNPGGDVDLIADDAITITPDDGANSITIGETHSATSDNPHQVTAAQTGALVSVDGVDNPGGDVDFVAGANMTITPNDGANTVTFSATGAATGWIDDGTVVRLETGTDSVGIGTTSPTRKLDVNGTGYFSGDVRIDGNLGVHTDPDPSAKGSMNNIFLYDEHTYSEPYIRVSGHNSATLMLQSRRVSGVTNGRNWKIQSGGGSVTYLDQFAIHNDVDGGCFYIRAGGLVGIGQKWPQNRLDIEGAVAVGTSYSGVSAAPTDGMIVEGNVGIGTASPAQMLHVAGNVKVDDTLFASNVSSNSPLHLQTAGTTRMYIDDAFGNIGIGTTSPSARLEVAGDINSSGKVVGKSGLEVMVPKGAIIMWSGTIDGNGNPVVDGTPDTNWQICDGTGGTPNLSGRFVVATGTHGSYTYNMNVTNVGGEGEEKHTLTIAEMPSHTHKVTKDDYCPSGGSGDEIDPWDPAEGGYVTSPTGGNQPHENRPPYYALAFIMRVQ